MTTKLLGLATLIICMQSCSQEEVFNSGTQENGNLINFSTYSNLTRGVSIENNSVFEVEGREFGATAFINTENYNFPYLGDNNAGAEIIYGDNNWKYKSNEQTRFWPTNGETLDFYAYTPFANNHRTVAPSFDKTSGMNFSNYTVSTTEYLQDDFMYATAFKQSKPTSGNNITMDFKHAMVQVHFQAATTTENLYVDIETNGITIHNINSKGNFTVTKDELSGGVKAEWSNQNTLNSYQISSPEKTISCGYGTHYDALTTNDNALILLPQTFDAWTKEEKVDGQSNAYLSIRCKIYTKTNNDQKVYLHGNAEKYETIYMPFSSKSYGKDSEREIWVMNNKVTYNLSFGGGYNDNGKPILDPIEFSTNVDSWTGVNDKKIDVQ